MSESGIGGSVCYESRESYSIFRRWHDLWKNNTHIDHEYQISIVLTLFFDDLSQTSDGSMLMRLSHSLFTCINNYLDGDL